MWEGEILVTKGPVLSRRGPFWHEGNLCDGCNAAELQSCRAVGCRAAELQSCCRAAGLQNCRAAGLQSCRAAGLQLCSSAKLRNGKNRKEMEISSSRLSKNRKELETWVLG